MRKTKVKKHHPDGEKVRGNGYVYLYDYPVKIFVNLNQNTGKESARQLYEEILSLLRMHGWHTGTQRIHETKQKLNDKNVNGKVNWNCSNCGEPGECLVMQDSRLLCENCYNNGGE